MPCAPAVRRAFLAIAGVAIALPLAALPWLCLKAGLLIHVGRPAFALLVAAHALVGALVLWRAATGRA